eukprot:TRINITY_DN16911_c0_g1_i1.p1 TRINITY_DN16911_c0_g1~~TRINITY_DN16911_c0_g1_i1.p1  ORF type:complete len:116 (+),score=10.21 TRINITY_DN16911_c0_g1_i1:1528-1875(+)
MDIEWWTLCATAEHSRPPSDKGDEKERPHRALSNVTRPAVARSPNTSIRRPSTHEESRCSTEETKAKKDPNGACSRTPFAIIDFKEHNLLLQTKTTKRLKPGNFPAQLHGQVHDR